MSDRCIHPTGEHNCIPVRGLFGAGRRWLCVRCLRKFWGNAR